MRAPRTLLHIVRGFGFSAGAFALANYRVAGAWFWLVGALFALDVLVNVLDVLQEPSSRAPLGGIPKLEYLLHVIGSMFSGGIAVAYFAGGWAERAAVPQWLVWQGNMVATGGALLTATELALWWSSRRHVDSPYPHI